MSKVSTNKSNIEKEKFKKRFQKRTMLEISALVLELEEAEELDIEYSKKFSEDFKDELKYKAALLDEIENAPTEEENISKSKKSEPHDFIKTLYREIAKKTHPDRFGDEYQDQFKTASVAYEEEEWLTLLMIAADLSINMPLFDQDAQQIISKEIEHKRRLLEKKKESLVWAWASSDDCPETRRKARSYMDIDEDKFQEFLKKDSM